MSRETEPLPFVMPPIDPSDPGYEQHRAMLRESERNSEFFLEHEADIFEQHPHEIAIIYAGGRVAYCSDAKAVGRFLETLDDPQRSAVHIGTRLSADTAWAL